MSEESSIEEDVKFETVSLDNALIIVANFLESDEQGSLKSSSSDKKIDEAFSIKEGSQPYLHVFNFENSGFAIVSASKKELPILAYSDNGSIVLDDNMPIGVAMWLEVTVENIKYINENNLTAPDETRSQWDKYSNSAIEGNSLKNEPLPDKDTDCITQRTQKGPYLSTEWYQGCGYNDFCPINIDGPCGRALVGCVAVAMGQIIRYYEYPSLYNYDLMEDSYSTSETALLLSDCGVAVGMDYGATGSSASTSSVDNALKDVFGYTSATHKDYGSGSYSKIESELCYGRPVILRGCRTKKSFLGIFSYSNCHAWICDGFKSSFYPCTGNTYLHLHMNWGWNENSGSYNGWFSFNNWAVTVSDGSTRNYKYANEFVYNINP